MSTIGSSRQTDYFFWIQQFLDRWYSSDHKAIFAGKRAILPSFEDSYATTPRHSGHPRLHSSEALTKALNDVGTKAVATAVAPGAQRRGKVGEHTNSMAAATNPGSRGSRKIKSREK